jgi:hypothetical protein
MLHLSSANIGPSLDTSAFKTNQITPGDAIRSSISDTLSSCPSDTYIVVKQPGVDASDFQQEGVAPHLAKWWSPSGGKRTASSAAVMQVQGEVDGDAVSQMLAEKCNAKEIRLNGYGKS